MALHNKTGSFNMDMTWVDAFQLKFGVTVDTEQFLIMRAQRGGVPSPVRHSLLENINVLIGEYKPTHPKSYKVFVVGNALYRSNRRGKVVAPIPTPIPMSAPTSRKAPAPAVSSANNRDREVKGKGPDFGCIRSKRESTNFNSIASRNAIIGKNFENPGTSKRKRTRAVRVTPPTATATTSFSEAALDAYLKEYNESCGVVDNSFRVEADDGNDEDDVRSEISQDSQLGDLHDLGIANQDIRTDFIARAKKNYSNSQFLMSRNELRLLKRKKANRWAKWTLVAPIATNVIRDLLGV